MNLNTECNETYREICSMVWNNTCDFGKDQQLFMDLGSLFLAFTAKW